MSFAFEIEATPNRELLVLRAGPVALAAAGFGLAGWLAPPAMGLGLVAAGMPACRTPGSPTDSWRSEL